MDTDILRIYINLFKPLWNIIRRGKLSLIVWKPYQLILSKPKIRRMVSRKA